MARIQKRIIGNDPKNVRWDAILEGREGGKRTRRVKTFRSKSEANDFIQAAHGAQPTSAAKFEALKDHFLLYYEGLVATGRREASTLKQLKEHLRLHIMPDKELSDRKCCDFTTEVVQAFLDRLTVKHVISDAMTTKVRVTLSHVFRYGAGRGFVRFNPVKGAKLDTSSRPEITDPIEPVEIPAKEDLRRLLNAAKLNNRGQPDNTAKGEALVFLLMYAGLRISELRGLRWSDCDLDGPFPKVSIHQKADLAGKIGKVKSKAGKREIGLGPATVNALKAWKEAAPAGDFVFSNEVGKPFSYSNLWNRFWVPLMNRAQLVTGELASEAVRDWSENQENYKAARFGFHTLRHVYASLKIEQGVRPKRLQKLMGHSTLTVTMDTYGHLWPEDEKDREMAAEVETLLKAG